MRSIRFVCFLILAIAPLFSVAQQKKKLPNGTILRAMQDEMERSMKDLRLPGKNTPFLILYKVFLQRSYNVASAEGVLMHEITSPLTMTSNNRLFAGDYSFNDESLDHGFAGMATERKNIAMPCDTSDYGGIRRSLWASTEMLYRGAVAGLESNEKLVKQKGKVLDSIPHRRFAPSPAVILLPPVVTHDVAKERWRNTVNELSGRMTKTPGIISPQVTMRYTETCTYITSTEGTLAQFTETESTLSFTASYKRKSGETETTSMRVTVTDPDKFPAIDELNRMVDEYAQSIKELQQAKDLEEDYNGPVLFIGPAVADMLNNAVFGANTLSFSNMLENENSFRNRQSGNLEPKIGSVVTNEKFTIRLTPSLKVYNGQPMLGAFDIDSEGIVPKSITLIESGVLKNMMNDRTLTSATQTANGYSSGPGVVEFSIADKSTEKELRDKLIAAARAEGLEYGLVVRNSPGTSLKKYFKVLVKSGVEELVFSTSFPAMNLNSFRKFLGSTAENIAVNVDPDPMQYFMYTQMPPDFYSGLQNGTTSLITPNAVLVGDVELKRLPSYKNKEEEFVTKPD